MSTFWAILLGVAIAVTFFILGALTAFWLFGHMERNAAKWDKEALASRGKWYGK